MVISRIPKNAIPAKATQKLLSSGHGSLSRSLLLLLSLSELGLGFGTTASILPTMYLQLGEEHRYLHTHSLTFVVHRRRQILTPQPLTPQILLLLLLNIFSMTRLWKLRFSPMATAIYSSRTVLASSEEQFVLHLRIRGTRACI